MEARRVIVDEEAVRRPPRGPWGITHGWWVVICAAYIVSPIDLMPELILGPLGIPDDIGMLGFGIWNFVRWRRNKN